MMINVVLPILGFLVGTMIGFSGMGGGFLMTPALIFLGFAPTTAVGTDLLFSAISKSFGATLYARRGDTHYTIMLYLLAGGIPASIIGYLILLQLETVYGIWRVNSIVGFLLAIILLLVSILHLFNIILKKSVYKKDSEKNASQKNILFITIGFLTGLVVQLTSIGSGIIMTFFLLTIINRPSKVVGTSLSFGVVIATLGGLLHFTLGHTDLFMLILLLIGSPPGIILGAFLSKRIPPRPFRYFLITMIIVAAVSLFIQYVPTICIF